MVGAPLQPEVEACQILCAEQRPRVGPFAKEATTAPLVQSSSSSRECTANASTRRPFRIERSSSAQGEKNSSGIPRDGATAKYRVRDYYSLLSRATLRVLATYASTSDTTPLQSALAWLACLHAVGIDELLMDGDLQVLSTRYSYSI